MNRNEEMAAHTGLEPVISALRGQRVNRLHQCAAIGLGDYMGAGGTLANDRDVADFRFPIADFAPPTKQLTIINLVGELIGILTIGNPQT